MYRDLEIGSFNASRSFSDASGTIQGKYWLLFAGTLIAGVIQFLGQLIEQFIPYFTLGVMFILMPAINAGLAKFFLDAVDNEPLDINTVFSGFSRFGSVIGAYCITILPYVLVFGFFVFVGMVMQGPLIDPNRSGQAPGLFILGFLFIGIVVHVVIATATFFVYHLIMDKDLGPIEAVVTSARAGLKNFGNMLIMYLIFAAASIVGILMCFIGLLFIAPVLNLFIAFCYRSMFPKKISGYGEAGPPTPDAYSEMFT